MFPIEKLCSKRVSTLNSVVQTLFAHESSINRDFSVVSHLGNLAPVQ